MCRFYQEKDVLRRRTREWEELGRVNMNGKGLEELPMN